MARWTLLLLVFLSLSSYARDITITNCPLPEKFSNGDPYPAHLHEGWLFRVTARFADGGFEMYYRVVEGLDCTLTIPHVPDGQYNWSYAGCSQAPGDMCRNGLSEFKYYSHRVVSGEIVNPLIPKSPKVFDL